MVTTIEAQRGYGILTVFASNLSSGPYSYALVINGKVAEARQMSKMK